MRSQSNNPVSYLDESHFQEFLKSANKEELFQEFLKYINLFKINEIISRSIDLKEVLDSALKYAMQLTDAEIASIFLLNSEKTELEFAASTDPNVENLKDIKIPVGQGIAGYVARTGETVNLANVQQDDRFFKDIDQARGDDTRSYLCIPLNIQGEVIGTAQLMNKKSGQFNESDERLMLCFTNQAAIAIEKAQMVKEVMEKERLEKENMRLSTELHVARRIQTMVLPVADELTRTAGVEIAARMQTATEVGGDFYDVLPGKDGATYFAIGDVTGHGLESGIVMLMAQAVVRTALLNATSISQALEQINSVLFENIQTRIQNEHDLTMSLIRYKSGNVTITGQHETVLIYNKKSGKVQSIDTTDLGMFLGIVANVSEMTGEITTELNPGDVMLLYTDGAVEAENSQKEHFELDRLKASLQKHAKQNTEKCVDGILKDIHDWIQNNEIYDDITLLAIKRAE